MTSVILLHSHIVIYSKKIILYFSSSYSYIGIMIYTVDPVTPHPSILYRRTLKPWTQIPE